jgi:hypothetical protein
MIMTATTITIRNNAIATTIMICIHCILVIIDRNAHLQQSMSWFGSRVKQEEQGPPAQTWTPGERGKHQRWRMPVPGLEPLPCLSHQQPEKRAQTPCKNWLFPQSRAAVESGSKTLRRSRVQTRWAHMWWWWLLIRLVGKNGKTCKWWADRGSNPWPHCVVEAIAPEIQSARGDKPHMQASVLYRNSTAVRTSRRDILNSIVMELAACGMIVYMWNIIQKACKHALEWR